MSNITYQNVTDILISNNVDNFVVVDDDMQELKIRYNHSSWRPMYESKIKNYQIEAIYDETVLLGYRLLGDLIEYDYDGSYDVFSSEDEIKQNGFNVSDFKKQIRKTFFGKEKIIYERISHWFSTGKTKSIEMFSSSINIRNEGNKNA